MRAILEFNLDEEGDSYAFHIANNSQNFTSAFEKALNTVRSYRKHGHTFKSPDEALESVYELLCEVHTHILD